MKRKKITNLTDLNNSRTVSKLNTCLMYENKCIYRFPHEYMSVHMPSLTKYL